VQPVSNRDLRSALSANSPCDQGRKEEKRTAQETGMRLRPRSGAGDLKGDLTREARSLPIPWLVEQNSTEKRSLTVQKSWLDKINKEAMSNGRVPLFIMVIGGDRWYAMPEAVFNMMEEEDEVPAVSEEVSR
jgi:hypothetical protein